MNITRTIEILREHNEWRRGSNDKTLNKLDYTTKELGIAIDTAIKWMEAVQGIDYTSRRLMLLGRELNQSNSTPFNTSPHGETTELD